MRVRHATLNDVPKLVDFWREHGVSHFSHLPYDEARFTATLSALVGAPARYCFILIEDAEAAVCGLLLGRVEHYFFSPGPIAHMMFYWVQPERRTGAAAVKLMLGFRKWAESRKASEIVVAVTSGEHIDRTDRFLKKMGFRHMGGNYSIVLHGAGTGQEAAA